MALRSPHWSTQTPFELQREEGESYTVVGYYSATPEEAGLSGYRVVKRTTDPRAAKRSGGT